MSVSSSRFTPYEEPDMTPNFELDSFDKFALAMWTGVALSGILLTLLSLFLIFQ